MKFMVIGRATKESEAGGFPDPLLMAEMGKFNEELIKAGVLLQAEGLHPSSRGARLRISGSERTVIDGPFTESKELIAGFQLWQVGSRQEAIEWLKRCPDMSNGETVIEIRQVFDLEDFGPAAEGVQERREMLQAQQESK